MTTLGLICSFLNGGTPSRGVARYYQGDVPWITGADISGPRADTARSFITQEAIRESATNRVPPGTVLLVTRTSVGKVALAAMELCFSQDITAITPDPRCLDRSYLVHFLRTKQPQLERLARGATIKGVTRKTVANLAIPLPTLAEQKRIAGVLDAAEILRAKRQEALCQIDTIIQSTFLDMFGDPVTNPRGWEEISLGDLAQDSFRNGLSPSTKGAVDGEVLTLSAITRGRFDFAARKKVRFDKAPSHSQRLNTNTFLICRGNGNRRLVGTGAYPDRSSNRVCFPDTMIGVATSPSVLTAAYLQSVWRTRRVRRQIERGARTTNGTHKINQQLLSSIVFPVPPTDLQHRFAAIVESVEQQEARQRAHLAELDILFASLQSRAFRGDL